MAITDSIPNIGGVLKGFMALVGWLIIAIIIILLIGFIFYFILRNRKFKFKIIIFENIGGRWQNTGRDRAMEMKLGLGGDTIFYLSKRKKYLPTPNIQVGPRTYWFAIRQDNEWINIGLESVDAKSKEMKIHFLDKDMRYSRASLQKHLKDRYDKPSFWAKYGGLVAYVALILITGIMVYLIFGRYLQIASSVNAAIDASVKVLDKLDKILIATDNICSSSGYTQVS